MKYKYEFEAKDDFEKGDCYECPFGYTDLVDYGPEAFCVLYAHWYDCPLVEVD